MSSLLVYGVIAADAAAALDLDGLAEGICVIAGDDIAAVAGTPLPPARPQVPAREDDARRQRQYQRVLEAIAAETTVLPVMFGTVAADEPAVRRMLIQGQKLLAAQLQRFAGRLQMDVVVEWLLKEVFIEIAGDPGIADLRTAAIASDDADAKFQLGLAVKAALDLRRAALRSEICEVLRPAAVEMAVNPLPGERTVASIALLMARDGLDELDAVLDRLDADYDGRLKFRCIGPRALSAFATVETNFPPQNAAGIKSFFSRIAREPQSDTAHGEGASHSAGMETRAKAHTLLTTCVTMAGEEMQLHSPEPLAIKITHPGLPITAPEPELEIDQDVAA